MTVFETLSTVNVNEHTEKKITDGGKTTLTYLSWPYAWAEVKKRYPDAHYTVMKDEKGLPYFSDPRTGIMVYTTVTIEGITHEMWLPVMDGSNKAMRFEPYEITTKYKTITVNAASMFDINKTIMRCLVKNLAMFGMGLYIYAGEDLPDGEEDKEAVPPGYKVPKQDGWNCREEMFAWCKNNGINVETFGKFRDALANAGLVEKIPSNKMSMDQFNALCDAIKMNFGDQLRVTA